MPRQACKTGRRKDQPKAGRTFTAFLECFVRGGPSWKMPVSKIFQASVVELTKAAVVKSHVGCSYVVLGLNPNPSSSHLHSLWCSTTSYYGTSYLLCDTSLMGQMNCPSYMLIFGSAQLPYIFHSKINTPSSHNIRHFACQNVYSGTEGKYYPRATVLRRRLGGNSKVRVLAGDSAAPLCLRSPFWHREVWGGAPATVRVCR
jgi:hypothetical protein